MMISKLTSGLPGPGAVPFVDTGKPGEGKVLRDN